MRGLLPAIMEYTVRPRAHHNPQRPHLNGPPCVRRSSRRYGRIIGEEAARSPVSTAVDMTTGCHFEHKRSGTKWDTPRPSSREGTFRNYAPDIPPSGHGSVANRRPWQL